MRKPYLFAAVLLLGVLVFLFYWYTARQAHTRSQEILSRFDSINQELERLPPVTPYKHDTHLDSIVRVIDSEKAAAGK